MPVEPLPPWLIEYRRQAGRRLRDLREARDLTQEQLAQAAGLDRQTIYRTELATHSPRADAVARLARALGVQPSELLPDLPPL